MPMTVAERDRMGGLAKGLAVIETFAPERPRQSISEVAVATGLDRATARRCLLTLWELGYADYDGKFFTLTPRVLRLGMSCLATMPLPQLVQSHLDRLSEESGESASVSILDGAEIVYVARAARRKVMSVTLMPGSRLPAYCTSMGRVLLADLPPAEARVRLGPGPLPRRTERTQTDPEALVALLARVRADGYAAIDQEVEFGLRSIAVPLVSARGVAVAALNLGVAARGEPMDAFVARYLPLLREVAGRIREILR
jgi:IclR family transcriptional regulator, pca regulon regulatory protein